MTLPIYVARRFVASFLRVTAIVTLLFALFEYLENSRRFAGAAGSVQDVMILSLLNLPAQIDRILPLIVLLASLTLFLGLARSSELVIARAAGVSAIKVVIVPVFVAMVIGVLTVAVINPILASTIRQAEAMKDEIAGTDRSVSSISPEGVWLRQALGTTQTVIHARRAGPAGKELIDVDFHVFDTTGVLSERYTAERAELVGTVWELETPLRWVRGAQDALPTEPEQLTRTTIDTNLTSEQILDSFAPPETISVWDIQAFITQMETSGFAATHHRLHLHKVLALPLVFAAMVLIGAGFTLRHVRFGNIGTMVVITVLSGFLFYAFQSMSHSLGGAERVPVAIAAWAPPLAAIMLAVTLLLHLEDG